MNSELTTYEPQELVKEKEETFDKTIRYLLHLSHEIEDIANVASSLINERRSKYNWTFEQNKHFLRDHAVPHLKRDKDGVVTGKSYKSMTAGGGVFFRQKPEKITIDKKGLEWLKNKFLVNYLDEATANSLITESITFDVPNEKALVVALRKVIEAKAKEKLEELREEVELNDEQAQEAFDGFLRAGEQEVLHNDIISIEEADPLHYLTVGSQKGWSVKAVKGQLIKALDGRIEETNEDEVEALIEDLKE